MENSRDKQIDAIYEDLVEIFDEEYGKRNLITPQNTAEKMTAKGYRKASDVAEEIFGEIEKLLKENQFTLLPPYRSEITDWKTVFRLKLASDIAELKKKYTESEDTE